MGRKLIISEEEKNRISRMYGLINEQPVLTDFQPKVAQKVAEGCSKISYFINEFVKKQINPYIKLIQAVKAKPENINEIILSYGKTENQKQKIQEFLNWVDGMSCDEIESTLVSAYKKTDEGKNVQEQVQPSPIDEWIPYIAIALAVIILMLKLIFSSGCSSGTCYRF
jgi:hypothetical protein